MASTTNHHACHCVPRGQQPPHSTPEQCRANHVSTGAYMASLSGFRSGPTDAEADAALASRADTGARDATGAPVRLGDVLVSLDGSRLFGPVTLADSEGYLWSGSRMLTDAVGYRVRR